MGVLYVNQTPSPGTCLPGFWASLLPHQIHAVPNSPQSGCMRHRRRLHHVRSAHHVPKERITQRNLICLVDKSGFFVGTPEGTRTPNPRNRNPMLYPLSHRCICFNSLDIIAGFVGFVKGKNKKFCPKEWLFSVGIYAIIVKNQ